MKYSVICIDSQNRDFSYTFASQSEAFRFAEGQADYQEKEYASRFGKESVSVLRYPFEYVVCLFAKEHMKSPVIVARYCIEEIAEDGSK